MINSYIDKYLQRTLDPDVWTGSGVFQIEPVAGLVFFLDTRI